MAMKSRRVPGLGASTEAADQLSPGTYLVRIAKAEYSYSFRKPFLALTFRVIEPLPFRNQVFTSRLYCTAKELWKLSWFLREFEYSRALLDEDELDERRLRGREGVVKISHAVVDRLRYVSLEAFAPAHCWERIVVPSALADAS